MSSEYTEKLAELIGSLSFVEPVITDNTGDGTKIQVICRVKGGAEAPWAQIVERILRKAEEAHFHAHICRLYFLKGDSMVYGWHIGITSETMGQAVEDVGEAIHGPKRNTIKTKKKAPMPPKGRVSSVPVDPSGRSYSPPLQADAKGNPQVKKQLMSMPFTGMENRKDRNLPTPPGKDGRGGGKGAKTV